MSLKIESSLNLSNTQPRANLEPKYQKLPFDVLEIISGYVDNQTLPNFSRASKDLFDLGLKQKGLRSIELCKEQIESLQELLIHPKPENRRSLLGCYQDICRLLKEQSLVGDDAASLVAERISKQLSAEFSLFKKDVLQKIQKGELQGNDVERICERFLTKFVAQALAILAEASLDPQKARAQALIYALKGLHTSLAHSLLSSEIGQEYRGMALRAAAFADPSQLSIIQKVLSSGPISLEHKGAALRLAIVKNAPISTIQALMDHDVVYSKHILQSLKYAARNSRWDIFQAVGCRLSTCLVEKIKRFHPSN